MNDRQRYVVRTLPVTKGKGVEHRVYDTHRASFPTSRPDLPPLQPTYPTQAAAQDVADQLNEEE